MLSYFLNGNFPTSSFLQKNCVSRKLLEGNGKISYEDAIGKAEREYKLFKQKELANLKSDFDDFLELREKIASYNAK